MILLQIPWTGSRRLCKPIGSTAAPVASVSFRATGKPVAVKLLRAPYARRKDILDRMRVEAQALAALEHPHLVNVTDFGRTSDGRPFLVTEQLRSDPSR
jgi:hypothetical protein